MALPRFLRVDPHSAIKGWTNLRWLRGKGGGFARVRSLSTAELRTAGTTEDTVVTGEQIRGLKKIRLQSEVSKDMLTLRVSSILEVVLRDATLGDFGSNTLKVEFSLMFKP